MIAMAGKKDKVIVAMSGGVDSAVAAGLLLKDGAGGAGEGRARPAFMESSRFASNLIGIRRPDLKVIADLNENRTMLFDLAADPGELEDRAVAEPDRHRLVVDFLTALGVDEATAEKDAEGVEHHVSKRTLQAFADFIKSHHR